ncbi:MAG: hypothetical protein LUG93_17070 [Lachnospiraceae bacterium]|nr:hypothetical protein [Lachnospiraceae bacterium]
MSKEILDIMEDLFNGKLYPAEQVVSESPRCREISEEICRKMIGMEETLEAPIYKEIEAVHDLFVAESDIMGVEYFKCGFSLGLQFMQESQEVINYLHSRHNRIYGNESAAAEGQDSGEE